MEEAEKKDIFPLKQETASVDQAESGDPKEIFYQLKALTGPANFDLRGVIKRSKGIDSAVKKYMLDLIDEAKGKISVFETKGFSEELAAEAAAYFDILQEIGEKFIPGYNEKLADYNHVVESSVLAEEKNQSDAASVAEKSYKKSGDEGEGAIRLVYSAESTADKNTLASESSIQKAADENYQGESPLFKKQAKQFRDVREAGNRDNTVAEKRRSSEKKSGGKEPPGGSDEESLKNQLDAAYEKLYGFLNKGEKAPQYAYEAIKRLQDKLMDIVGRREPVGEISEDIKSKYRNKRMVDKKEKKKPEKIEEKRPEKKKGDEKLGKKKEEEIQIGEDKIACRAADIERRRVKGEQPGFTWTEIDKMLDEKGLAMGSKEREAYIHNWDKDMAVKELEEIAKTGNYELVRLGAEITLSKITNYGELNALTEQEGDEKFKQKTRELWKEFAVHGKIGKNEKGEITLGNFTDLDGKSSLGLLKLAGIEARDVKYVVPGERVEGGINIDTGNVHGIVFKDGGKTVFIDHHSDESGKDSSATKFTYELLVSLGLLEKQEYLDKLIKFVTQEDNKTSPAEEKYFKNYWRNLFGLQNYITFDNLTKFFKEGHKPYEVLQEKDLKHFNLFEVSKKKRKLIDESLAAMEKIKEKGLEIETARYGKAAIDLGKKVPYGFDAARYSGYDTYIIWSPEDKSFFISSVFPLTDSFAQGKKIRGTMWIKPMSNDVPLTLTLKEVLSIMTDGKFEPKGELAEFLAKEEQSKKIEQALAPELAEAFVLSGQEFRDHFLTQAPTEIADWSEYEESEQRDQIKIETKKYLRKVLKDELLTAGLIEEKDISAIANNLWEEMGQ